jgi:hypothetical protein
MPGLFGLLNMLMPLLFIFYIGICPPLDDNVLGTDDVVEILEFLLDRNPALLCSRDHDGSLVNCYKASVKSVTPQGDLPLFIACEIPEPSLDTIFLLIKLYPDVIYQ